MGLDAAVCLGSHTLLGVHGVAVSEPHEAYRELGRLKAQQGLLAEAMMHYKHLLFFLP
jgi:GMP synthase-like glutamine amidotransferase